MFKGLAMARRFMSSGGSLLPIARKMECFKSKGQHLLVNPRVVEAMVTEAGIRPSDSVLEIGPGTGNLTLCLLPRARKVVAVEIDPRMVEELCRRVQHTDCPSKLEVIHADILKTRLPVFDLCVANIPYKISSPLCFKLLSEVSKFRCAVLMFQREFAKRLLAMPGDPLFCRLSVNMQLLAKVELVMKVGRGCFSPAPKVDSSVVRIIPNSEPPPVNLQQWDRLIRICFSRKNKTLGAIFKNKSILSLLSSDCIAMPEECSLVLPEDDELIALDEDGKGSHTSSLEREQLASFKKKVFNVLQKGGYEQKRAVKLAQEDFMTILSLFNDAKIHFVVDSNGFSFVLPKNVEVVELDEYKREIHPLVEESN